MSAEEMGNHLDKALVLVIVSQHKTRYPNNIIMKRILIAFCLLVSLVAAAPAQTPAKKTVSAFTEKLQKIDGFMPIYLNGDDGKIYLEITRFNKEFLYLEIGRAHV